MMQRGMMVALLLGGLCVGTLSAPAQQQTSRLSRMLLNQSQLYLPTRMTLGEPTRFVIKGQPGMHVRLYLSPEASGYVSENGQPLRVGSSHEVLEGKIQENGLLEMNIELPGEESLEGRTMFVEAALWSNADESDLNRVQLVDASGRRTGDNGLVMSMPADNGHMMVMPMLPGMNSQTMQQLSTLSETLTDDRKRDLMYDGQRDEDTLWDRNSLITRPGLTPIK